MKIHVPIDSKTRPARWPHHEFRPSAGARTRASRGWPGGLIGMLALVAALEWTIAHNGSRYLDHISISWALSAQAANTKASDCDVLYVGDSLVKHSLIPRTIDAVTGRRSYNLATAAGPAPINYTLFRRALDAGAHPRAVVFDLKSSLLVGGPEYTVRKAAGFLSAREVVEFCLAKPTGAYVAKLVVGYLIPSYRSAPEIRESLRTTLCGEKNIITASNEFLARNWDVNAGAIVAIPRPDYHGEVTEAEHLHMISRGFHADRVNAMYAQRFVSLTTDRQIDAYLLLPPLVPNITQRREQTGAEGKYTAFIRSLQEHNPTLTVLDARQAGYPASAFIDPIHMNVRGALALSADVAAILKRDLDRPPGTPIPSKRWLPLPAYQERPMPTDLEDVERSRAKLNESRSKG